MIKAPFIFDIQYFSVLVILKENTQKQSRNSRSEDQKEIFQDRMSENELISAKAIRKPLYCSTLKEEPKQKLYFIIQNKRNLQFYASVNTTQEMEMETKTIFSDVVHLYLFVRKNCDSEQIKMTKKGNLILDYFIDETIYQLKIENKHFLSPLSDIQEIWKDLESSWDHRQHFAYDQSQKYLRRARKGKLQLCSKMHQNLPNKKFKQKKLERNQFIQREKNKQSKRLSQNINIPEYKKIKVQQKRKRRRHNNHKNYQASSSEEIGSERFTQPEKNQNYKQQDQNYRLDQQKNSHLKRQRKQKLNKMIEHFPEHYENNDQFQSQVQRKSNLREIKTNDSSLAVLLSQSLKRIQTNLENISKQSAEYVIETIREYFDNKMDQIYHNLASNFSENKNNIKHNFNIKSLYHQVQQNQGTPGSSFSKDVVFRRAQSIFCKEKQQILSRELQLPKVSIREHLQRMWKQLSTDSHQMYMERAKKQLKNVQNLRKINQEKINRNILRNLKREKQRKQEQKQAICEDEYQEQNQDSDEKKK